jgi:type VI secretion system secreted protein VgrG
MEPNGSVAFEAGNDSLSVRQFTVVERMNGLFDVSVVALSPHEDVDFETIVGQGSSFRVEGQVLEGKASMPREWHGVCCHFEQIQAEDTGLSTYLIRIVPRLWLTTQRTNNRIFQHLTAPEIVRRLLGEWGIEPVMEIHAAAYPRLEYRVQYGESDFAFISRMLEEAGISYRFEQHPERGTDLVLSDEPTRREARAGGPIPFVSQPNPEARRAFVTRVRSAREIRGGKVTLRDFDYRGRLDYPLFGESKTAPGVEAPLERYRYLPGSFVTEGRGAEAQAARADQREGTALAERGFDAERALREVVTFETNVLGVAPGTVLEIGGHPRAAIASPNRLLVVEMRIDGTSGGEWTATARAVHASTPLRPLRLTPKPTIHGVQSAIVTGPAGEEIHTDELGRVRVQFPWDREGKSDENSSCWMRVAQGWAGAGFGTILLPRVGQEVTVGFYEGDPDQPVILGRVYNSVNQVPHKLPENKTRSGIRTQTSPAESEPAYSEILFEDKKDHELLAIRAQRDLHKLVKLDEIERTGRTRTIRVGRDRHAVVKAVDSTLVGERYFVGVEDGGEEATTHLEMTDKRIVFTTGEATVTWDGPDLSLEAKRNITITAHEGDVVIKGGPHVKINC